jgi:hypothetical protein
MTLDSASIDLSKSFLHGMSYVALSRISSLQGLYLTGLNDLALEIDPLIIKIEPYIHKSSKQTEEKFKKREL